MDLTNKHSAFTIVAKHSDNFIILLDEKLTIKYLNPLVEKVFYITLEQLQDKSFQNFCEFTHLENFLPHDFCHMASPSIIQVKFKNIKNLSYLIDWVIEPVYVANKLSEIYLIGSNRLLKENELSDYIHDIIACTPGSLYWKDKAGRYLGCNEFMVKTSELNSVYDIVGKTDFDLWPASAKRLEENDRYVIETGETVNVREKVTIYDGTTMYFAGIKMPLRNEKNEIIGVIGNSLDITSEIEAEQFKSEKIAWQRLAKYLKAISGSLAHELKTPLAGVKIGLTVQKQFFNKIHNAMHLMADESQRDALIQELKEEFPSHMKRIEQMINRIDAGDSMIRMQMKNISAEHIDTGHFMINSISQCIASSIELFPFETEDTHQKIHVDIERDFTFWGDGLLTKHIIWNLLNNALFFIKEQGKGEIFITVQAKDEGHFMVTFRDTAKGMSPAQAQKVFTQFYTGRKGGTGLGLHFCYLVMQSYDGHIDCHAVEGEYAEFILTFPIKCKQRQVVLCEQ
jgi:two-component system, OmpR family, aerobic respiration control sensor histidine kinase ArcB